MPTEEDGENKTEVKAVSKPVDITLRLTILVLLAVQNAAHALMSRYSKGILREKYSSTEVVLVGEVIKFFVAGFFSMNDNAETDAVGVGFAKLSWLLLNSKRIILLVILYSLANLLTYYALARVEASVYSVLMQLKILTTAAFAVLILGRNISSTKWRALFLLVLSCILVASPAFNSPVSCNSKEKNPTAVSMMEYIGGVMSILVMVLTSGYSSIYFEQMLKMTGERLTIWERNFQLAFYSVLLLTAMTVYASVTAENEAEGFLKGWTINAWIIACIGATGGLLVAATLKYADAILKSLATSASIVLSTYLGFLLLGGPLDVFVTIGAISTILAIFNYTLDTST